MAYGDAAAEQHEQGQPTEYGLNLSDEARKRLLVTTWNSRLNTARRAREAADEAEGKLWTFMEQRACRGVEKPYEICGDDDGQGRNRLECQLPQNHRDLGYRNHLEMKDGKVWGAWS